MPRPRSAASVLQPRPPRARSAAATLGVALLSLFIVPPAGAHGGLESSTPADGARVTRAPREVTMTFSEVPSKDSVVKVVDACTRDVVATTKVVGNELVAELSDGQPGRWKASYRVISAEDGHLTKGTVAFTVAGKKDCNPDGGDNGDGDPTEAAPEPPGGDSDEDGGSVPVVPIALGAAGLVAVGLVVRRVSGG